MSPFSEDSPTYLPLGGGRIQRAIATATLASTFYRQGQHIYRRQRRKRQFEISVPSNNELYRPVEEWIIGMLPPTEIRAVEALAGKWKNTHSSARGPERGVVASFEANIDQRLEIEGHSIRVTTSQEQPTFDGGFGDAPHRHSVGGPGVSIPMSKKVIRIECKSAEARDHILKIMDRLLADHDERSEGSRCFVLGGWGEWSRRDFMSRRPLDTVYLPGRMKEDVTTDLKNFLDSEKEYLRIGLPWHRGYMFSGIPGTGKTSLAKALSSHFDLDIYVIALPDLKKDSDLTNALTRIEAPAILLIEDIDVASAASSREEKDDAVSLSGLLNALDGVGTPHGLVTIMTSNHPEVLDPALIRAGRVDYKLECPPMRGKDLRAMVEDILHINIAHSFRDGVIAADVMEVLKRNMHADPAVTVAELVESFGL